MDIPKNARLTPLSRGDLVRRVLIERQTPKAVATAFGVCLKTAYKWIERFQAEGEAGFQQSAVAFLRAAIAYYNSLGVTVTRVMTDNGSCYKSRAFARACRRLKLKHIRTKPYTPKTNGKAERFIQTALREWAYARAYDTSKQRAIELPHWIHRYNWHRPHGSLKAQTPISRLSLAEDNLLRLHI